MEDPVRVGSVGRRFTPRLRLEPIGAANAHDLWLVLNDDEVSRWYDNDKPSPQEAKRRAESMGDSWRLHGVHKWIAYDRHSGEVVGRGGLSRTPVDEDWGRVYQFLPSAAWVRIADKSPHPFIAHANWLEIGWALRHKFWGRGYASEIGRAGLTFAFDVLEVQAVVSCTDRPNVRSRAVMERIGMAYGGELWSEQFEGEHGAPLVVYVLLRTDWQRPATAV